MRPSLGQGHRLMPTIRRAIKQATVIGFVLKVYKALEYFYDAGL